MEIFHGYEDASNRVGSLVYAIGNFDGVHLGHESLIRHASQLAVSMGVECGVYTFWPHPRAVLFPSSKLQLITTREQKLRQLESLGVEYVVEEPFTLAFASMSAEAFCAHVIAKNLRAAAVVTGSNFHFGRNAEGNVENMLNWLMPHGIPHELAPPVFVDGALCSSSRIRNLLLGGEIENANALLGRPFEIVGTVVSGEGRGQKIGFPTANLKAHSTLIPKNGVYATDVRVNGYVFRGATNIGTRPTFSAEHDLHIETHLLDFHQNIYGKEIVLTFLKKIRNEKKFESLEDLKAQIEADISFSRKVGNLK